MGAVERVGLESRAVPPRAGRHGRLLGTKLVLVLLSVVLAAVHGIIALRRPRRARPLAIAGLATSIGIVVFATALVP